jgi:prepilin-type N-terminal cleavage/methylation domain-containing protein
MKHLRGFTFLEVLTALTISAILLPVIGVTMYDLLVMPPEQSARLTINNELQQLSAVLYNDGYRADNFSEGEFPVYGNFSWTDYSTGLYHLVSYYWTGNCTDGIINASCNHIARTETITAIPTPTPTVTSTPTVTPTPTTTPTPTAAPTLYTYCTGNGTDKWAWARTWTNHDGVTDNHPWNPSDFVTFVSTRLPPYPLYTATTSDYGSMCLNDSSGCPTAYGDTYWRYADISDPMEFGFDSQLFTFKLYQDRLSVTNLSIAWSGHGSQGVAIYHTTLQIYNYQTSSWSAALVDVTSPTSQCFNGYIYNITTNPGYYIEAGSGNVSVLVKAVPPTMPATQGIYTDYIALTVH